MGGTHHAAPRTDSPMELAMPIAVNRYGLTWRNRNPRYAQSTSLRDSPGATGATREMPRTSTRMPKSHRPNTKGGSRGSMFSPLAVLGVGFG